jgi:hypothetical protein
LELRPPFSKILLKGIGSAALRRRQGDTPCGNHTLRIIVLDLPERFLRFPELKRVQQSETGIESGLHLGATRNRKVNVSQRRSFGRKQ